MELSKKCLKSIVLVLLAFGIFLVSIPLINVTLASTFPVVKNPGFESPTPSDWVFTTTSDPPDDFGPIYPAPPHTGAASAGIGVLNAEPGDHAEWSQLSVSPVYGGVLYNLTAWVYITGPPNLWVDIGVIWQDKAGTPLGSAFSPKTNSPSGVWFQIWTNITGPAATKQVTLVLRVEVDEVLDVGQVYFDDVEFFPLDSVSAIGDNSPGDHDSYFDPDADSFNEMLQMNISASKEALTQINFTLQAFGTADDHTDIIEVDLVYDQDGNGLYDNTTESVLDSGTYPQDNGTLQLNATTHIIPYGQSHTFLIVYQLAFTSDAGETFGFNVTQIRAWGVISLIAANLPGPPYTSAVKTTVGSLLATPGANTPGDHTVEPSGFTDNVLLQLDLYAYAEDFTVYNITVESFGTGDDANDVTQIRVVLDVDGDGQIDAGESSLASNGFDSDNGSAILQFNPTLLVGKRSTEHLLIALTISDTAANRSTYGIHVTDIDTEGAVDGSSYVVNLPISSAIKTIIKRPSTTPTTTVTPITTTTTSGTTTIMTAFFPVEVFLLALVALTLVLWYRRRRKLEV